MKTKKVNRYYCDHCGKGSCAKSATMRHEGMCFRNPIRWCPICGDERTDGGYNPTDVSKNVTLLKEFDLDAAKLLEHIECPACVMSAILQCVGKRKITNDEDFIKFDYKASIEEYTRTQNAESFGL